VTAVAGVDVGTTGAKGVAIDERGRVVASAEAGYTLSTPRPGWTEQDPDDWSRATAAVLDELSGAAGPLAAIGLAGQMHGLVALDGADRPLRPAILWNDQRTGAECAEIEAIIGRERLVELTGNRALAGFTAPKLLWMRRNERDLYGRIEHVLLPKDYVRLRLCGERATDVADASGTLLLDVARRRWSEEVLAALAIPPEWLPRLHESPALAGRTAAGVPVAAGAGDQAAAAVGVGADRPGPLSIALGTSGVVLAALERYAVDPYARLHSFCHAVPHAWQAMGVMLSAAGSLRWLRDAVAPGIDYDRLFGDAAKWPPATEGLLFLPYLAGERTPHADPAARGAFVGVSLRHDRGALVRAVLEGVAFGLADSLDLLRQLGVEPSLARTSGGGARSDEWLRIVASVLELPLERVTVDEGAAFGAALLGGVAAGIWPDVHAAVAATVKPGDRIEPVPDWLEPYRESRARYRALYPALKAVASIGD
jgi:xylulokinase